MKDFVRSWQLLVEIGARRLGVKYLAPQRRHRTTDPGCVQSDEPRYGSWLARESRSRSCPLCFPPALEVYLQVFVDIKPFQQTVLHAIEQLAHAQVSLEFVRSAAFTTAQSMHSLKVWHDEASRLMKHRPKWRPKPGEDERLVVRRILIQEDGRARRAAAREASIARGYPSTRGWWK